MGWANCGQDSKGRPIGYAHAGTCDETGCERNIDRGLSYACGGMHGESELYCEGYFCPAHLSSTHEGMLCARCRDALGTDPDEVPDEVIDSIYWEFDELLRAGETQEIDWRLARVDPSELSIIETLAHISITSSACRVLREWRPLVRRARAHFETIETPERVKALLHGFEDLGTTAHKLLRVLRISRRVCLVLSILMWWVWLFSTIATRTEFKTSQVILFFLVFPAIWVDHALPLGASIGGMVGRLLVAPVRFLRRRST